MPTYKSNVEYIKYAYSRRDFPSTLKTRRLEEL